MRKCIYFLTIITLLLTMAGCTTKNRQLDVSSSKIASICNLATLKCYYNNVAKYEKKDAEKVFLFWSKDRKFWVEYSGIVTFGIDASLVRVDMDDENNVVITIPKAKILTHSIDTDKFTPDCFYIEGGSAKVTAENVSVTMQKAQDEMLKTASENEALFIQAQESAKNLLKEYVENFGEAIGVEYNVTFKDS
ncbi:MAG: DUF4230 domain-containing protein [Acutalibacteraceae bacterium]